MLFKTAYTKHPYFRPVIGYVETVSAFSRDQIIAFYKKWYQPQNMCLVVVGDVKTPDVVKKAESLFASNGWGGKPGTKSVTRVSEPETPSTSRDPNGAKSPAAASISSRGRSFPLSAIDRRIAEP